MFFVFCFFVLFVWFVFTSHETVKEYDFEQLSYLLIDTLDLRKSFCLFGLGLAHDLFLFEALRRGNSILIRISRKNLIIVNNHGSQLLDNNLVVFVVLFHALYTLHFTCFVRSAKLCNLAMSSKRLCVYSSE